MSKIHQSQVIKRNLERILSRTSISKIYQSQVTTRNLDRGFLINENDVTQNKTKAVTDKIRINCIFKFNLA